jgi:alpha-tubulin suppressor-like RCC1 family protein
VPVQVSGLSDAVEISADNHSCARLADGSARCWGHNASGQLGDSSTTQALVPVTVSGLTASVSLSARGNSSCAVLARGTARCWGNNDYGQLGDASSGTNRLTPVGVVGL